MEDQVLLRGALQTVDYVLMAVYFSFVMIIGLYMGMRIKTGKDFFLAGRALPWWAIGMSLVVSDIGAVDIMAIAGDGFTHGIVLGNFDWIGSVPIMIIAGFVFIPYFWRSGVYTIPEFLGRRYSETVRMIVAAIWSVVLVFNLGIMLYLTAEMINLMLGNVFLWVEPARPYLEAAFGANLAEQMLHPVVLGIFFSAMFIGLYTLVGGLGAVVYTDVLQCAVMMIGTAIALFIGINAVGGISGLVESVQAMGPEYENHFELVLPADTPTSYPWTGILMGLGFVLAPAYWIGNQSIVQRSLGARSEFEAKVSFIWGSLLKLFIPILMVIPGLVALVHNPEIDNTLHAVPMLIRDTLPVGLLGIFFAAFLAAFMSSVDSHLNSSVTLLTNDFYRRMARKDASEAHFVFVGRLLTFVFILWGIGFAIWVMYVETSIYTIIQTVFSMYQGPSLAIIILGVLWSRTTAWGALYGLSAGICCSCLLMFVNRYASEPLFQIPDPFLYIAWWAFVVAFVTTIAVSLCTRREPEEKLRGLVYHYKEKEAQA